MYYSECLKISQHCQKKFIKKSELFHELQSFIDSEYDWMFAEIETLKSVLAD